MNKTQIVTSHPILTSKAMNVPVEYEWNRTWGGIEYDRAFGVATDSLNNVYLGGITDSYGNGNYDIFLVKYDKFGTQVWNRTWGYGSADYCEHIAIDSQDNIYLAGQIGLYPSHVTLVKFDHTGTQLWNITWGGTESENCFAVATDPLGNVYLTGATMSFGADLVDMFLVKFNSSGDEQWYTLWGGSGWDTGRGLTLDSSNNIYIAGETNSYGAGGHDMALVKYSNMGVFQWNRTWGGVDDEDAYDVKLDSSGSIYVSGRTSALGARILVKYDNFGVQVWNVSVSDMFAYDRAPIALDSSDNIFFGGYNNTATPLGTQIRLVKINGSGVQLWDMSWGLNEGEYGEVLTIDSSGNIYIAGYIRVQGFTDPFALLVKFDNSDPFITINEPIQYEFYGYTAPTFNLSIIEPNLNSTWYSIGTGVNITFSGSTGIINQTEWNKLGEGTVNIEFYANDSMGYMEFASVLIEKDLTPPTSIIDFRPQEGINIVNDTTIFTINADDGSGSGIFIIKYRINESSWYDYSGPFTLEGYSQGTYKISYFSIDVVENVEIVNEVIVELLQEQIPGFPLELIILIATLSGVAVIGLATILLIRRKRTKAL
jgi:hypothetical protein